ncbi:MAG: trehalase family glycosidase [Lentisphaeria bacterium]|jgi:hypothetical protein|nr:trehalase family glycosidase [Lentisphaeria bacterium]
MNKPNDWLAYSIVPSQLRTTLWPAMWGNGQLELMAELNRPCVREVVCFGFGSEGLRYDLEQHLIPAVYDDETGEKYPLDTPVSSGAQDATVIFQPARQTWRYEFDDLAVDVSLILPRLQPGYFFKLELSPKSGNRSRKWRVYHQLRGHQGNILLATEAGHSLARGTAWCRSRVGKYGEAIGSNADAEAVNLGLDYDYANDIMIKTIVEAGDDGGAQPTYFARALGSTVEEAREGLAGLVSAPEKLEAETEAWWNRYLDEVPRLEVPDESFAKNFLWSWADFRMNRIDVQTGEIPGGFFRDNNVRIKTDSAVNSFVTPQAEVIQLLHDDQPARDVMLYVLRGTRQEGLLRLGHVGGSGDRISDPGNYVSCLGHVCGMLHKYLLNTGDMGLLSEPIGDITVLQRLEDALEAELAFRDTDSGLFWTDGEMKRFPDLYPGEFSGLGPALEAVTRYRGGVGSFYNDTNAMVYGTLLALADIEELARNAERSERYRGMAEDLRQTIQEQLWDEELGFFIDRRSDGSVSDYIGIGGFITGIFANHVYRPGGVATREQAERLAAWCNHPDFAGEFGVFCLARSSPYFDSADYKGYNSGFDMHWSNQVPAGLYAHGCYEEAHRQLFKLFRRLGENGGLGPRYRGEVYHADTGEILPQRFVCYGCILSALTSITEGVFGIRWTRDALTVHVNSPWPWAKLSNLKIRKSLLDLELTADGSLVAMIDGNEAARDSDGKVELAWELFG